jgi:multidrug resistance efflux pump
MANTDQKQAGKLPADPAPAPAGGRQTTAEAPPAPAPRSLSGRRRLTIALTLLSLAVLGLLTALTRPARETVLTGIVTTDEVIVSAEIEGRLQKLLVRQGDAVKRGDLLGVIQPKEWQAEMAFYAHSEKQSAAQVAQAEADLKYQQEQTSNQIRQAEANLASAQAQVTQAKADQENAGLVFQREEELYHRGVEPVQAYDQARTANDAAKARVESLRKQVAAAEAAVALAQASAQQTAARQAALDASLQQQAAATAQKDRAQVRLDYTEIRAPIDGFVDVRAALQGEVVNPGQAIVTLIDPNNLWVRADVEEGCIDRILLDQTLKVRLPSGRVLDGKVFYRAQDADYATQRDVSRTKRDIKTFEIRLRCDNRDRELAVGMSAYVTLPPAKPPP